jgi:aerobic carbon-monoxide dehydrogenase large subunit
VSILGNRVFRREDPGFLTTGGTYVEDLPLEGAAWVTFVRSTVAHARLVSIDTAAARALPGVLGVFTDEDLVGLPPIPPVLPSFPSAMSRTILARGVVRYVGEAIAAVVAADRHVAVDAADLVIVAYEPMPVVIDPSDAERGQVVLFPQHGSNIVAEFRSPAEADFSECAVVVELDLDIPRMTAAPLETRSGAACWSGGRLTHWSACQGAHPTRDLLTHLYQLPPDHVRVIVPDVGGGFGAKSRTYPDELSLGFYARAVGRPVRWTETRTENIQSMPQGRGQRQRIRIGGDRHGRVSAYQLHVLQDAGAYPLMGAFLPMMTQRMLTGVYDIENVGFSAVSVVTNATPTTAFRGAGRPEATIAIERAIDAYAAEIGKDPAEVRYQNMVPRFMNGYRSGIGTMYDVGDFPRSLDLLLESAGYEDLRREQAALRRRERGPLMGIGIGAYVEITAGAANSEFGRVDLLNGGGARVFSGATPNGQGHDTTWAMLVADRTGIPMDKIDVVHGDTDRIRSGFLTVGSRSVQVAGAALAAATSALVDAARGRAAELLEADAADVVHDPLTGRFHVVGAPALSIRWDDLAATPGDPLSGSADFQPGMPTFPFGAHLAVVDVDRETGKVVVRRMIAVDDAGTVLNPLIADGQVHGGLGMGIAEALLEKVHYDADGNPLTTTFADYPVISAAELPSFELVHMATPTFVNELGAKGVGESGTVGAVPAVQNAVIDALAHLGVRHLDLPLTPERVWQALHGR